MKPSPTDLPLQVILLCPTGGHDCGDVPQTSMYFRIDLGDVRDMRQLLDAIGAELMFPFELSGWTASLV